MANPRGASGRNAGATFPIDVIIVDTSGAAVTGTGNGYINDGVDAAIRATVVDYANANPLTVRLTDTNGDYVGAGAGTQYTQDAALTVATTVGSMAMGRASAAVPAGVSADNDAVLPWYLRSGAIATVITAAGALVGGDATNGLDVDVTRMAALVAGAAVIGKVGIDQTTPGTTDSVSVATAQGAGAAIGATSGAAVITDANGTIQQYLRGLVKLAITAGSFLVSAAQSGTWTVQPGNTPNSTPWLTTNTPKTSGGWDTVSMSSGDGSTALTNTAQTIKGSAGQLGGWYIYNPNSAATYVIIYNNAGPTVGTTNPQMVLCIPALGGANVEFVNGISFATAITAAATTTGPGASAPAIALEANFFYK